jgi:hypothetical protein
MRFVLGCLDQAHHGLEYRFGLGAQIVDAEPGQRCRPIERLRDARALAQIFLADDLNHAGDL